jgi:hypothetical protein
MRAVAQSNGALMPPPRRTLSPSGGGGLYSVHSLTAPARALLVRGADQRLYLPVFSDWGAAETVARAALGNHRRDGIWVAPTLGSDRRVRIVGSVADMRATPASDTEAMVRDWEAADLHAYLCANHWDAFWVARLTMGGDENGGRVTLSGKCASSRRGAGAEQQRRLRASLDAAAAHPRAEERRA